MSNPTRAADGAPASLFDEAVEALAPEFYAAFVAQGFAGIVALMRAHSDDTAWQIAGCCHLSITIIGKQRGTEAMISRRAGDAGAVAVVVAALRGSSAYAACFMTLFYLVEHCERNGARACAAGAVEVLAALLPALRDPAAARFCALSLAYVAGHSDDTLSTAVAAGVLPALVGFLRAMSHTADDFEGVLRAVDRLLEGKVELDQKIAV